MNLASTLPVLLGLAWLLPLVSFALIVFFGPRMGPHGKYAALVATGAILGGFVLSLIALVGWVSQHPIVKTHVAETEHGEKLVQSSEPKKELLKSGKEEYPAEPAKDEHV